MINFFKLFRRRKTELMEKLDEAEKKHEEISAQQQASCSGLNDAVRDLNEASTKTSNALKRLRDEQEASKLGHSGA
jgi:predicted  nucleic acid-binding Zn-ribbon protein